MRLDQPEPVKPLRVTLVTDTFLPDRDDRTLTVRQTADRLMDAGHNVQILTASPGITTYRGAPVHRITGFRKRGSRIDEALASFRPDLMHATSPDVFGRKALKQALRGNLATVVVEQAPLPNYLPASYVEQVIARADRFLVTSHWVRSRLAERGISAHTWSPGVDLDEYHPRLRDRRLHDHWARADKPGGRRMVVGYVGGLHKRFGVRRLEDLADNPDVRLVVIGAGPQLSWLRERLPEAKFLEPMSTGDLGSAIASFDVLLHPGRKLTCGHALRSAAASGIPTVAPRRGAAAEIVTDGETGLLYDSTIPSAMTEAIKQLLDPAVRGELGAGGRIAAEGRDWATAVDELTERHYPAVVLGRRRPPALAS